MTDRKQQEQKEYAMRKTTMMSFLVLVVATVMLSGCIYPGGEGTLVTYVTY